MPMANIQNVIKKHSSQSIELKQLVLEMKLLNKIYVLATVYTDNTVLSRQQIATTLRKNNAVYADCKKVFEETAVVEAIAPPGIDQADFLETCTDHAIECGAEDVDVVDETSRRVVFTSHPQSIYHLAKRLGELGYNVDGTDSMFIPKVRHDDGVVVDNYSIQYSILYRQRWSPRKRIGKRLKRLEIN